MARPDGGSSGRVYGDPYQGGDGLWHYPYTDPDGRTGEDLSTDGPGPAPAPSVSPPRLPSPPVFTAPAATTGRPWDVPAQGIVNLPPISNPVQVNPAGAVTYPNSGVTIPAAQVGQVPAPQSPPPPGAYGVYPFMAPAAGRPPAAADDTAARLAREAAARQRQAGAVGSLIGLEQQRQAAAAGALGQYQEGGVATRGQINRLQTMTQPLGQRQAAAAVGWDTGDADWNAVWDRLQAWLGQRQRA